MAVNDQFKRHMTELDSPAYDAFAVTPNDSTELSQNTRAILVGVAGNIKVTTAAGNDVTLVGLQTGQIIPIRVSHIHATDTTATSIVAFV